MNENQRSPIGPHGTDSTKALPAALPLPPLEPEWAASRKARSVEFAPSPEEVLDSFHLLHASSRRPRRAMFFGAFLILALIFMGFIWSTQLRAPGGPNLGQGRFAELVIKSIALVLVSVGFFGAALGGRRIIDRNVRKLLADPKTGDALLAERRITIAPQGCLVQYPTESRVYLWSVVKRLEASDNQCLLVADPNLCFAAIPRRAFLSENAFDDFVSICRRLREDAARSEAALLGNNRGSAAEDHIGSIEKVVAARAKAAPSSPLIGPAESMPRPLCTPAERLGMFCVTWGWLIAVVTPVVGTLLFVQISQELNWQPPRAFVLASVAVSGLCLVIAVLNDFFFAGLLFRLYLRWRTRRRIAGRPDALVAADDPQALFAQVVPRENWYRRMMESATDRGWMVADLANHQLLFEGVRERWVIPAECIEQCPLQHVQTGSSPRSMDYFALLVIRDGKRLREFPLRARNLHQLKNRPREREQAATNLASMINSLRQVPSLA
jgi:hypothetical protein